MAAAKAAAKANALKVADTVTQAEADALKNELRKSKKQKMVEAQEKVDQKRM